MLYNTTVFFHVGNRLSILNIQRTFICMFLKTLMEIFMILNGVDWLWLREYNQTHLNKVYSPQNAEAQRIDLKARPVFV